MAQRNTDPSTGVSSLFKEEYISKLPDAIWAFSWTVKILIGILAFTTAHLLWLLWQSTWTPWYKVPLSITVLCQDALAIWLLSSMNVLVKTFLDPNLWRDFARLYR